MKTRRPKQSTVDACRKLQYKRRLPVLFHGGQWSHAPIMDEEPYTGDWAFGPVMIKKDGTADWSHCKWEKL